MIKKCSVCFEEFETKGRKTICPAEHKSECLHCETKFPWARNKKFCSASCSSRWNRLNNLEQKICRFCAEEFEGAKDQPYCANPHPAICIVCEKDYLRKFPRGGETCSKQCTQIKREATNLEKYGVKNSSQAEQTKKAISNSKKNKTLEEKALTKERIKATNQERYGVDHPLQSKEIMNKVQKTNVKKYGVVNAAAAPEVQAKTRKTNLERYGVEHSGQAEEVKAKIKQTNLERYGVENVFQSKEHREKAKITNLERYGHENPASSEVVKNRIKETNREKYGVEYSWQAEEVKTKIKQTMFKKYGVENAMQSEEIRNKVAQTIFERYGVHNIFHLPEIQEKIRATNNLPNITYRNVKNLDDFLNFEEYLKAHPNTSAELAKFFNVSPRSIDRKAREGKLDEYIVGRYTNSVKEALFASLIPKNINFLRNDRKVLGGKELDFYFPDHKIAVEISPTTTHNSLYGYASAPGKTTVYHQHKFKECEKQGIELITIFDWHDWDKITEMIFQKIAVNSERIYARKCKAYFIEEKDPDLQELINQWHVLGAPKLTKFKAYTVLSYENEIVGIALWTSKDSTVSELKRLVFKPNMTVVGGASKLLKAFERNSKETKEIFTFSDNDLGRGSVYEQLGFTFEELGKPNKVYHHLKEEFFVRRTSLVRQGADRILRNFPNYTPVGIGDNLPSNEEIIESYGFLPIYDCGYKKWRLKI